MSKVFEVRVMGDCWHRYKVTICKFPGSGRARALGTIWGVTPGLTGAANTDAWRSLSLYCLLGYKRIRRQKHDSETRERITASQGICERLSLYLRRQNADINCPCHFWSAMCSVCPRVVRIILVSVLGSVMSPHTRHTFKTYFYQDYCLEKTHLKWCCINFQTVVCSLLRSIAL